jgi:hypothetical protein
VPDLSKWHHGWCRYSRETLVGKEEEAVVSSAEENKAIVRRFYEALTEEDLEAIRELLAPTSSITGRSRATKTLAARATYGLSPRFMLSSPMSSTSSRSRWQPNATG